MTIEDLKSAILILVLVVLGFVAFDLTPIRMTPSCWEDSVLVGVGDFENGRWTEYRCGPALDDFVTR